MYRWAVFFCFSGRKSRCPKLNSKKQGDARRGRPALRRRSRPAAPDRMGCSGLQSCKHPAGIFKKNFNLASKRRLRPLSRLVTNTFTQRFCEQSLKKTKRLSKKTSNELKQDTKLVSLLRNAVESSSDESGWAHLGSVGSNIAKQSPQFVPRNYGYGKLGELVAATNLFDIASAFILNSSVGRRHFVSADYHCPLYSKIWLSTSLQ